MSKLKCPICNEYYVSLINHIKHKHNISKEQFRELYPGVKLSINDNVMMYTCYYCNFSGTIDEVKKHILQNHTVDGKIKCPICNESYVSLITHLFYNHNMTSKQFNSLYPGYPIQISVAKEKQKCPYCDFVSSPSGIGTHIAYKHKDLIDRSKHKRTEGFLCPICNKYWTNFSQHIEMTHKINWEDFVKEYNWTLPKTYVSDEHKKSLSKNKKRFYNETERGIELRQEQSILMGGKGNIIHLPGVRGKVSESAANRIITGDKSVFFYCGIRVAYKGNTYRSLEEFKIALLLMDNNIEFEYENEQVLYVKKDGSQHRYLVDFKINDVIFEIKCDANKNQYENEEKYKHCRRVFGNKFKIVNAKMLCDELALQNKKIIINSFFIEKCFYILNNEDVVFSKWNKNKNYSFFKKLDPNYETNKKFICL